MKEPYIPTPNPAIFPITPQAEAAQRASVIAEAKTWIGTPYRQLGDSKGASIDCSMLLVRCLVDAGIFEPFDPRPYPPNWHLHKKEEKYIAWMDTIAVETQQPKAGDIVLFKYGQCFSHSGLMITPTRVVHAYVHWGFAAESEITEVELFNRHENGKPIPREKKFYDVWAKLKGTA